MKIIIAGAYAIGNYLATLLHLVNHVELTVVSLATVAQGNTQTGIVLVDEMRNLMVLLR